MKSKFLMFVQPVIIIVLIILLIRSCNENQNNCSNLNFENSPNRISDSTANAMEELYKANQFITLNQAQSIEDYREYWFPLKELKSYICHIEEIADELNYTENGLGIRVYNAARMEDAKVKSSIFMVGTHNIMLDQPDDLENEGPPENVFFPYPNVNIDDDAAFNMGDPGGGEFKVKGGR